jgi:hypothetical protein
MQSINQYSSNQCCVELIDTQMVIVSIGLLRHHHKHKSIVCVDFLLLCRTYDALVGRLSRLNRKNSPNLPTGAT